MQKIVLVCVGRLKSSWLAEGAAAYIDRLTRQVALELLELPASKEKDPLKQAAEESLRLLAAARKFDGDVWLLDERGKAMTSPAFSMLLSTARDRGTTLVFLLGGAYGCTDELRRAIPRHLRLSDMTLPHELCRVLFLEQLYRACEIQKGSGYHH